MDHLVDPVFSCGDMSFVEIAVRCQTPLMERSNGEGRVPVCHGEAGVRYVENCASAGTRRAKLNGVRSGSAPSSRTHCIRPGQTGNDHMSAL